MDELWYKKLFEKIKAMKNQYHFFANLCVLCGSALKNTEKSYAYLPDDPIIQLAQKKVRPGFPNPGRKMD